MTQNAPELLQRYVLDTDTVTYEQMARPSVLRWLARTSSEHVMTTVVTMSEQLRGRLADLHRARNDQALRLTYERLQSTHWYYCHTAVLPFDRAAADIYASLVAQRVRIGTQDLRIAAIVLANDTILVTSNRRDFERVPGLSIEDWTVE